MELTSSELKMLDSEQVQIIRETVRSVLTQCNIPYKPTPYDNILHQECIDDATHRGYAVDGDHTVVRFLPAGVVYASTAGRHLERPAQVWLALYLSAIAYIDEVPFRFPSELSNLYAFNEQLTSGKQQRSVVLDNYMDIVRRAQDIHQAIPSKLITTSSMNYITASLLEHETVSMQIPRAAQGYPIYFRERTGIAEAFAYMAFSRRVPWTEYIQAIPDVMLFFNDLNDVLSFYKEELAGEDNTHISILARRDNISRLDTFKMMADTMVIHLKRVLQILEGSPNACEEFKHFYVGYFGYHISSERYKLADLNL